jgi:hypothetical protein
VEDSAFFEATFMEEGQLAFEGGLDGDDDEADEGSGKMMGSEG